MFTRPWVGLQVRGQPVEREIQIAASTSYMKWLNAYGGCTEALAAYSFLPIWYTTFEPELCK